MVTKPHPTGNRTSARQTARKRILFATAFATGYPRAAWLIEN